LKPWKIEGFAGRFFAMEMREDDFMGEKRRPFKSGGPVLVSSANQFMLTVGKFDEFCLTKLANEFSAIA